MALFLIFIVGLAVGSFLNVVILRLHEGSGFVRGRSRCPRCRKTIAWYDTVPLVSFIMLRGKCRSCSGNISWQYPAVELCTAVLFAVIWFFYGGLSGTLLRDLFFVGILIVIFVYDLRWYIIPDAVTLPAMVIALAANIWLGVDWLNLLLAAAVGGGFFLAQFLLSRGRWVGGGDIRLGALIGLMLGWPQLLAALFVAYVGGAIISVGLLVSGKKSWSSQVPFGTFLSIASVVTLLWGQPMLEWYVGLLLF